MGISQGVGLLRTGVCTSTTRPASPYSGQQIYETDTGAILVWKGSSWSAVGASKMRNIATFTASGTWTVPTGVTYAVANILGAGGGAANSGAGTGGTSSVAFAGGTVSAVGGIGCNYGFGTPGGIPGANNSGKGARASQLWTGAAYTLFGAENAQDGALIVYGGAVTAGASITVTVGSGGTGAVAGGSGLVYIEFEV
jgi:hypothetical protein